MRALIALVTREYLEHRGSFLYAPAILLAIVSGAVLLAYFTNSADLDLGAMPIPSGTAILQAGMAGVFLLWSIYLLIALAFYYADSFSADRRDNALLFWKSMPQSDLKFLTSKALSGITIFLLLILAYALATAILFYALLVIVAAEHSAIVAPEPFDAASGYVQMGIVGAAYLMLTVLWYAPGLAWIAGLSTLFRRWSIPLAALIPATVVLLEYVNSVGGSGAERPIAEFLAWRFRGFPDEAAVAAILVGGSQDAPVALTRLILAEVDWLHLGLGLIFAAAVVFLASEYRRRSVA